MDSRRGFDISGGQDADYINNVARDQYFTQVLQERQSFLREVAAARTRARVLVTIGFLMLLGGAVAFMLPFVQAMNDMGSANLDPSEFMTFGPEVGGVSIAAMGFAVAFIGQFVLVAGIVMHIVAAARRRHLNDLPPLPPEVYGDRRSQRGSPHPYDRPRGGRRT